MRPLAVLFTALGLVAGLAVYFWAQPAPAEPEVAAEAEITPSESDPGESPAMNRAEGSFDVRMIPQDPDESAASPPIGRMILDKTYRGDLEATGKGQMLALRTATEGSAGYVAMEQVTGTLAGRQGSFVLQHSGTMNRGDAHLDLHVMPDSGTGELEGLSGTMEILIEQDGSHRYVMEYTLVP